MNFSIWNPNLKKKYISSGGGGGKQKIKMLSAAIFVWHIQG